MEEVKKNISGGQDADGCPDCNAVGGFKRVFHLPISDIDIYLHRVQRTQQQERSRQTTKSQRNDFLILHNANPMEFNKSSVIGELNNYKPNCMSCKGIIRRVQNLLEEIKTIRKNETYASCDHCKMSTGAKCKRCEYVVSEFKQKDHSDDQRRNFKEWLRKVKELLQTVVSGRQLCRYGRFQGAADVTELEKLLKELHCSKNQRQPEIGAFPSLTSVEDLRLSQDMVREVMQKLKTEGGRRYSSLDSLYVSHSQKEDCVCKFFRDRVFSKPSTEPLTQEVTAPKVILEESIEKRKPEELPLPKPSAIPKRQPIAKRGKEIRPKEPKGIKALKISLMSATEQKPVAKKSPKATRKASPKAENRLQPLVTVHNKQLKLFEDDAATDENTLTCEDVRITRKAPKEMIRGLEIVPIRKDYMTKAGDAVEVVFFNEKFTFDTENRVPPVESKATDSSVSTLRKKKQVGDKDRSGVIMYRLSDRKFIDNGWTQLPATKTMRRMNIFKMLPASSFDWFGQTKRAGTLFYETGEKMTEIDESGRGFWFYKNGLVALEYFDTPDSISQKMFTVFSHQIDYSKKPKCQNVLACFDYSGNGVVYDSEGNERLKYNQSEGYVFDSKISAPGRWKWHTMNDPPVLEQMFIDTHPKTPSPELEELMKKNREPHRARNDSDAMLDIELKKFAKLNAEKFRKSFKSFEIRMKAVKVNDYFALKLVDQSNVYLLYREGSARLKLNLGMLLQSDEIVATEFHEPGVVETPYDSYDRRPSRIKPID